MFVRFRDSARESSSLDLQFAHVVNCMTLKLIHQEEMQFVDVVECVKWEVIANSVFLPTNHKMKWAIEPKHFMETLIAFRNISPLSLIHDCERVRLAFLIIVFITNLISTNKRTKRRCFDFDRPKWKCHPIHHFSG